LLITHKLALEQRNSHSAQAASDAQVKKVNYAGLPSHPDHALHLAQATSGGSLLSFETGSTEASKVQIHCHASCTAGYHTLCGACVQTGRVLLT